MARIFLIICLCALIELSAWSEDYEKKTGDVIVSGYMETIKEGGVNILVPQGGRLKKESSFLLKEDADEYASRKFSETETRFKEIEKELASLKDEMKDLREAIESMR